MFICVCRDCFMLFPSALSFKYISKLQFHPRRSVMATKKASAIISSFKAAFTKTKPKQSTSTTSVADADITSPPQTATEPLPRASEDIIRAESQASKQAETGITEPFTDFFEYTQPETSEETAVSLFTSQPPTTTNRPTSARPIDIISKYISLLPTPGPQKTIVDLHAELSNTGNFTSPLPINPAATRLSRAHFKCTAKHARLKKSSNVYAPTLCTTCHRSGDVVFACCRFCYLRICRRCAGLLRKCGNDLKAMLEELVRLGVWRGLQGQG
jgi:hypothetical protein